MNPYSIWYRLHGAGQRRAARWFARRRFQLRPGRPIVSFTFDDFPKSALERGGAILEQNGVRGTYYTALGLAGTLTATGEMFSLEDLHDAVARGHELGCHTFDHCPAWSTAPSAFEASVRKNAAELRRHLPSVRFRSLSYPISYPRPGTKRRIARHFPTARGGGQVANTGMIDLNYLSAYFLEQSGGSLDGIRNALRQNHAAGGWLIFATHDVSPHPTRFGCTPDFFAAVVRLTVESGAEILPVGLAGERIREPGR